MSSNASEQLREILFDNIGHMNEDQQKATDMIYYVGYKQSLQVIKLLIGYTLILACTLAFLVFPILTAGIDPLRLYLGYLFLVTVLRCYHYNSLRVALKEETTFFKIAEITQHLDFVDVSQLPEHVRSRKPLYLDTHDFRDPDNPDIESKLKMLIHEIKVAASNINRKRRRINKIQFLLYQISHFSGILFLFFYNFEADPTAKIIIGIVILIGTYQYVQFYLLMVFVAIIFPYYFARNLWRRFVQWYRAYKLEKVLLSETYSEKSMKGDHECKICLQDYE